MRKYRGYEICPFVGGTWSVELEPGRPHLIRMSIAACKREIDKIVGPK